MRRLITVVLVNALLLVACGDKPETAPGSALPGTNEQASANQTARPAPPADPAGAELGDVDPSAIADLIAAPPPPPAVPWDTQPDAGDPSPRLNPRRPLAAAPDFDPSVYDLAPLHLVELESGDRWPLFTPQISGDSTAPGFAGFFASRWSDDGARFAAIDDRGVHLVTRRGLETGLIGALASGVGWHPNSPLLAVAGPDGLALYNVPTDAPPSHRRRLADGPIREARWSPNGQWLAFVPESREVTLWNIAAIDDPANGGPDPIVALFGRAQDILWLPDGRLLAGGRIFDPERPDDPAQATLGRVAPTGAYALRAISLSGNQMFGARLLAIDGKILADFPELSLTRPGFGEGRVEPGFSPNGDRLALVRRSGNLCDGTHRATLVVVGIDGTRTDLVSARLIEAPAWSPRGDWISYGNGLGGPLHLVDPTSGEQRLLIERPVERSRWTPAGDAILYWPQQFGRSPCG